MSCKNSHYFYSKTLRSMNAALILLFLLAQSATLLHAEVHDFHDHEDYCDTFKSLEKHHYFIGVVAISICPIPPDRADTPFHLPKISLLSSLFYEARASPILIPSHC
ncbi:MAG: hypothetical protein ABW170_11390 [Candidatus Thiodiazotropha sp. L084R]